VNEIVAEEPANEAGSKYLTANRALIDSEAAKLKNDSEVAEIASLLYAAQTLLLAVALGPPMSDQAYRLGERATKLGFWIPSTYDLCGTDNALDAIRAIAERSKIVAANTIMPEEG
jgi:hypothetical protein